MIHLNSPPQEPEHSSPWMLKLLTIILLSLLLLATIATGAL